ncbi:MAG TPA: SDR family oxidoreductase [Pirellulales bacterium]|jgi:NAD(P)-dependent dehydrogenase (short-subunit alcohol dehydrogenase family)|nr:SDR family oxidoreductase [Pirellulales bacterium]
MHLKDKVAVVTGGANGIGRALCRRFAAEGARGVVVADLDMAAARTVADEMGGLAVAADVGVEAQVRRLVDESTKRFGPIDLFCSNAGIAIGGGVDASDSDWQKIWDVNLMAHVYAARAVIPAMRERGNGYLLNTASAAGLLTSIGSAPYAVTKHAAVALAEWMSISYGPAIKVSCLCPQGVFTDMLMRPDAGPATESLKAEALQPEQVADSVIEGLAAERFLILPHEVVSKYMVNKATDNERWLRGMRRLQADIQTKFGNVML